MPDRNSLTLVVFVFASGGAAHNWSGGPMAVLSGAFAGFFVGWGVWTLGYIFAMLTEKTSSSWRPPFPPCAGGRCGPDDFEHHQSFTGELSDAEKRLVRESRGHIYRCKCKDHYFFLPDERRFLKIAGDGKPQPYMRHTRTGRKWIPDHEDWPAKPKDKKKDSAQ